MGRVRELSSLKAQKNWWERKPFKSLICIFLFIGWFNLKLAWEQKCFCSFRSKYVEPTLYETPSGKSYVEAENWIVFQMRIKEDVMSSWAKGTTGCCDQNLLLWSYLNIPKYVILLLQFCSDFGLFFNFLFFNFSRGFPASKLQILLENSFQTLVL